MKKYKKVISPVDPSSPWMTIPETAAYTHLGINAIRNFIWEKLLTAYKPRKVVLLKRVDVDKFMEDSLYK